VKPLLPWSPPSPTPVTSALPEQVELLGDSPPRVIFVGCDGCLVEASAINMQDAVETVQPRSL